MTVISKSYDFYRTIYTDKSVRYQLGAADTGTVELIEAKNANWTLYIQRILLAVTTDAAQSLTFQDDSGTVVVGKSAASPGLGIELVGDYGPEGRILTAGEGLDMVISGAGLAAQVIVEAYQRPNAVQTEAQSKA